MTDPRFSHCHYCKGPNTTVGGPGRFAEYRGVRCEYPADLYVDTCTVCGRSWLDGEQIKRLNDSFEAQRLSPPDRRLKASLGDFLKKRG